MANAEPFVIGVDVGTQSTKAVLVRADGRIVATHSQSYQVETPAPLWAQQWPSVWMNAAVACIKGVLAQVDGAQTAIKSICISSLYGGSGIPVDADGKALYPCLIWMDRRAQAQVDWVRNNLD
ncbi:FGGY family carbohydrate kinase, partial [Roseateles sp. GG27B]